MQDNWSELPGQNLGDRMKEYEIVPRVSLTKKVPVLARFDGKAFHSFTKKMQRPYDEKFNLCMWDTAKYLCENIQGAKIAYVQSDEITVLITDYETEKSDGWFDYQLQKMCSVGAGYAAVGFLTSYMKNFLSDDLLRNFIEDKKGLPVFDARFWNLPLFEVVNVFIWRQQDATKNSISALAQSKFSTKQLHGKNSNAMQDMLFQEYGINWNDCSIPQKRGVCIVKEIYEKKVSDDKFVLRSHWIVDQEIPIFTQDKNYIEKYVYTGLYKL